MSTYTTTIQSILNRYHHKKTEAGLSFTPPPAKKALGEFAFADDVLNIVLIGVVTGVLKDIIVWLVKEGASFLTSTVKPRSVNDICETVFKTSSSLEEGVKNLTQQGIQTEQATAAIELLKESIQDELAEGFSGDSLLRKD